MPSRLPWELIDHILHYLQVDSSTLKSCSLVCRSWTHTCHIHLFRHLHVHLSAADTPGSRTQSLFDELRSSASMPELNVDDISSFVKSLCLRGDLSRASIASDRLLHKIAEFRKVETLKLTNIRDLPLWRQADAGGNAVWLESLGSVRVLTLKDCGITLTVFFELLWHLPHLHTLILDTIFWHYDHDVPHSRLAQIQIAQNIHTLVIGPQKDLVLFYMLRRASESGLLGDSVEELRFDYRRSLGKSSAKALLKALPSLKDITIRIYREHVPSSVGRLKLRYHPNLVHIRFSAAVQAESLKPKENYKHTLDWVCTTILNLRSSSLSNITFDYRGWPEGTTLEAIDWTQLCEVLRSKRRENELRVVFRLRAIHDPSAWTLRDVISRLPGLEDIIFIVRT